MYLFISDWKNEQNKASTIGLKQTMCLSPIWVDNGL